MRNISYLFLWLLFSLLGSLSVVAYDKDVEIVPRTPQMHNFPCMECHNKVDPSDKVKLPLKQPHQKMTFNHMDTIMSCYQCHHVQNIDQLILNSGELISFNESHLQCLQCHGEKTSDWKWGIHGSHIGAWNGKKIRLACVECHNPHEPVFPQMVAVPPPKFPKFGIPKEKH